MMEPGGAGTRPRRVAAIDCGTNSIRLLIAEPGPDGSLVELDRRLEIVRLGQGVDATGEFHPDALRRTFAAVDLYAEAIRAAGVGPHDTHFVATSASRDAANRAEFFAGIAARLGVEPDVISGDEEAQLAFTGALSGISPDHEPVLVMDVGGGSTELILGSAAGQISRAVSLNIGSVRLTERFLKASPPAPEDVAVAADYIDHLLAAADLDLAEVGCWVGVAGTVTTLAAAYLGLETYDRQRVHGTRIASTELDRMFDRLRHCSIDQIRAWPSMPPGRADVITGGALIVSRVAHRLPVDVLVISETDILDGIALQQLAR